MRRPLDYNGPKSRKNSELDRDMFLAMVAHELRTPASAILSWATLLREGQVDGETLTHGIEAIERNATLQLQLIEQLLDLSRVNNRLLRLDTQTAALMPILEAAVDTMLPQANAKGIDLHVNLDPLTGAVVCDPARLQQVVTNVLVNAIKFTPSGGRVDIRLERQDAYAKVTVSDTGRGIRPENLPYIFDAFIQAGTDNAMPHGGLGLGLTIARQIIESHDGKIYADSPGEGKGAKFTIILPLVGARQISRLDGLT
jgi:signal transduction histidine kinase